MRLREGPIAALWLMHDRQKPFCKSFEEGRAIISRILQFCSGKELFKERHDGGSVTDSQTLIRESSRARMFDSVQHISVVWPPAEDAISSKRVNQVLVLHFHST
jgi:hypothetical protein